MLSLAGNCTGQGLNCDEKGELADEESKETFEEALEDEPNNENVRFDDDILSLCVLWYTSGGSKKTSDLKECPQLP